MNAVLWSRVREIRKHGSFGETMVMRPNRWFQGHESLPDRGEVLELIRLCNLSHMPEKLTEFIEQNVSTQEAREILMELLAERTKKTEILSAIPQNSGEELMMQVAKSRAQPGI